MQSGVPFIVIDNENLKYTDMLPYISEVRKSFNIMLIVRDLILALAIQVTPASPLPL